MTAGVYEAFWPAEPEMHMCFFVCSSPFECTIPVEATVAVRAAGSLQALSGWKELIGDSACVQRLEEGMLIL